MNSSAAGSSSNGILTRARAHARHHGRRAADNSHMDRLGRLGFAARGSVYLVVGLLTLRVAGLGPGESPDEEASTTGAFRAVSDTPFGTTLLAVLVLGMSAYALWRLTEAAGGHRDADGHARTVARLLDLARTGVYTITAVTAADLLFTGSTNSQEVTADRVSLQVMQVPAGRWAVAAGGVVLALGGCYLGWQGLRRNFMEDLHTHRISGGWLRVVGALGTVGYVSRGLVFATVGVLGISAAMHFDPDAVSGFDGALRQLVAMPAGTVLVGAAGFGLLAFGSFSLVEARYRDT